MDYMLPGHLEDLLREEGVEERVVDSTVALGKVWHDRAEFLNYIYHIRRRSGLPGRRGSFSYTHACTQAGRKAHTHTRTQTDRQADK